MNAFLHGKLFTNYINPFDLNKIILPRVLD